MTTHCEACGDLLDELDPAFGSMHERCVERLLGTMCTYSKGSTPSGYPFGSCYATRSPQA